MASTLPFQIGGVGIFQPNGDTFFDIHPGAGSPITFKQTQTFDEQKRPHRRNAPGRSLRGYVGLRTRSV